MIQIDDLIKEAMKSRDSLCLKVYKLIKTDLSRAEHNGVVLDDTSVEKILRDMVKRYKDSIDSFNKGGRTDLAEQEKAELNIVKSFLPKEADESEIVAYTQSVIDEIKATEGQVSMKNMKAVLAKVQEKYSTADGRLVSGILKANI